jgi:uncharacterized membrane protein YidH (DUF202 family)
MTQQVDADPNRGARVPLARFVFYPFLFLLFPALSLYSRNMGDVRTTELVGPIALLLIATVVLWIAARFAVRDAHFRGVLFLIAIGVFFSYADWSRWLRTHTGFERNFSTTERFTLLVAGIVATIFVLLVCRRWKRDLSGLTQYLNVASIIVLILAVSPAVYWKIKQRMHTRELSTLPMREGPLPRVTSLPDIYYVMLDMYTSTDYMKEAFGYDNQPFIDALKSRGFYIADHCRSNYSVTCYSLPTVMNLNYVHNLLPGVTKEVLPPYELMAGLIQNNVVGEYLRERGYEYVTYDSGLAFSQIYVADDYLTPKSRPPKRLVAAETLPPQFMLTSYQAQLASMTPLRSFLLSDQSMTGRNIWDPDFKVRGLPFILGTLGHLQRSGKPLFVFAHILSPHPPHRFDASGNILPTSLPHKEGYVGELQYLNKRLLEVADAIQKRDPHAVIIFQGDHGPWTDYFGGLTAWPGTEDALVRERTSILNAIYLPDESARAALYRSISPVNTFRVVFNAYLNTKLELLPDESCISRWNDCLENYWIENPPVGK